MALIFDIETSLEFWRKRYRLHCAPGAPPPTIPDKPLCSKADVLAHAPQWAFDFATARDMPIDILVFGNASRWSSNIHQTYSVTKPPEGSFYELKPGIFIESPAFMFLRAASILDLEALIAFGDELCGLYSFDEREKRGFRKRTIPLVTKDHLKQFLEKAKGATGRKQALRALEYVVERSASPMETLDEMTLCLPYKLGGYGIPPLEMNAEVPLTSRAARVAKRRKCYLDMGCVEKRVDIEHHGKLDHSSEEDVASDHDRVNGLKEMGFEVIELTKSEVGDLFVYEIIVERIADLLGKRIHKEKMGATPERLKLRQAVFAWNHSSGKIRA